MLDETLRENKWGHYTSHKLHVNFTLGNHLVLSQKKKKKFSIYIFSKFSQQSYKESTTLSRILQGGPQKLNNLLQSKSKVRISPSAKQKPVCISRPRPLAVLPQKHLYTQTTRDGKCLSCTRAFSVR